MPDRRQFLQATALGSAWLSVPASVRAHNTNSKLQLVGVGCEAKGWSDISSMASHPRAEYVGFCDVDLARTERVRKLNPDAPVLQDYRELFDKLGDRFDAVTVSTPDHMHAPIALAAMKMGKHVFCQKPLTHTIYEARRLTQQAEKSGVITRMGNQIHSHEAYRTAVATLQQGVIGKIKEVRSWCAATGHGKSFHISRPQSPPPVPKTLNWNLWLGVAPLRPYGGDRVYHPWGWRDWQDFGNGALGDFGCHIFDPVFTALKIAGPPRDCLAEHTGMNEEVWPAQNSVRYRFPGTQFTTERTIPISWDDGGRLPSVRGSHVSASTALPSSGSLFIGETGSLVLPHVGTPRLYPTEKFSQADLVQQPGLNHYHGWIDGCLSGEQPSDGFDYAGPLTEAVLLGNIAVRYRGQKLQWNAESLTIPNLPQANQYVTKSYRDGFELEHDS